MTSLLTRRCPLALTSFLRIEYSKGTYLKYSSNKINTTPTNDYEIDENLLLTEENRKRCLEKMCKAPPVGIKLRGAKTESKFASVLIALCTDEET